MRSMARQVKAPASSRHFCTLGNRPPIRLLGSPSLRRETERVEVVRPLQGLGGQPIGFSLIFSHSARGV